MTTFATHDELLAAARASAKAATVAEAQRIAANLPGRIAELVSKADELMAKWSALHYEMSRRPLGPERLKVWEKARKAETAWREADLEARKAQAALEAFQERAAAPVRKRPSPSFGKRISALAARC
ncbi:hypothetical protein TSH7_01115 [Azospirillum sp. TSH7]|uniref:hypothetical protein n=1 Tax=unclassified Azospirillum TaxID=2630922 RepID=UPI000D61F2BC|nr:MULTISPECIES: hypothetical protein [unclassified Azospirillum]PWC69076.1 hypothetical protein TSH7_01115 [Azospirillum sp. TSH7]PWC71432.1 hypothetical protein TSH20_03960 [Azospirillum sp. TSH20]